MVLRVYISKMPCACQTAFQLLLMCGKQSRLRAAHMHRAEGERMVPTNVRMHSRYAWQPRLRWRLAESL